MEEGHLRKITSPLLTRSTTVRALEVIQQQVDKAEEVRGPLLAEIKAFLEYPVETDGDTITFRYRKSADLLRKIEEVLGE